MLRIETSGKEPEKQKTKTREARQFEEHREKRQKGNEQTP